MSTDSVKMDTGVPLFFSEFQYLLLETIPLETIMRVFLFSQSKKARLLSDDDSSSAAPSPVKSNGYGFGGMPSPDIVQSRLDLLKNAFPNKVRSSVSDTPAGLCDDKHSKNLSSKFESRVFDAKFVF